MQPEQINLTGLINDCISFGIEYTNNPSEEGLEQFMSYLFHRRLPSTAYVDFNSVKRFLNLIK